MLPTPRAMTGYDNNISSNIKAQVYKTFYKHSFYLLPNIMIWGSKWK